jgi:hypothetical protein
MAITRSFDNAYTITDYTEEMNMIPNKWNLIGESGLFSSESVATNTFTFDKTYSTVQLAKDTPWTERSRFSGNEKSEMYSFTIPHFTLDDSVTVGDVWNKRMIGTADQQETRDKVLMKKMAHINGSWDITLEYAMCEAIRGNKYAPNNATINTARTWYDEFNKEQQVLNFDFDNIQVDQRENVQAVVRYIQDAFKQGGILEDIVFYCTPKFFAALVGNAQVMDAYTYYESQQSPQRQSLRKGMYREFVWQNVTFIEYRGKLPDGLEMMPEGDASVEPEQALGQAWAVPRGSNAFTTFYAPAYRFDTLGQGGASRYMWTYEDRASSQMELMTESNFLTMNSRPELVIRCQGGVASGSTPAP